MADYSFMKSGSTTITEPDTSFSNNLLSILELFTSNSIKNSSRFITICGRNGITEADMKYGLIYEVFEFFKRNSNIEELKELEKMNDDEVDPNDYIIPEDQLQTFSRIDIEEITNPEDKEFVSKLYRYYDNWDEWVPQTPIEKTLKKSIDKINIT